MIKGWFVTLKEVMLSEIDDYQMFKKIQAGIDENDFPLHKFRKRFGRERCMACVSSCYQQQAANNSDG